MKKKIVIDKIAFILLLILCFFPYINILRIPSDAQPNALIVSILLLSINTKVKFPERLTFILLAIVFSFCIGFPFIGEKDFSTLSSLISYLSLFFITIVSFIYLKKYDGVLSWKLFCCFLLIHFIVSILQFTVDKSLFSSLFYRVGTSLERGVTGLTPEPTFNATIAVFFLIVFLLNFHPKRSIYLYLIIFIWILVLAMSTTVFLVLLVTLTIYCVFRFPKYLLLLFFPLIFFISTNLNISTSNDSRNSRIGTITNVLITDPSIFLILDQSVNDRISHIFIPIYITFDDYLIPHSANYAYFNKRALELKQTKFPNMFFFNNDGLAWKRIMSGWGMLFYECGLIGVGFFAYFCFVWLKYFHFKSPEFLAILIFISIMFTAVSINTAFVPFIFGNVFYKVWKKKQQSKVDNISVSRSV